MRLSDTLSERTTDLKGVHAPTFGVHASTFAVHDFAQAGPILLLSGPLMDLGRGQLTSKGRVMDLEHAIYWTLEIGYSTLEVHCSTLAVHCSTFKVHCSTLAVHCSTLKVHGSTLAVYHSTLVIGCSTLVKESRAYKVRWTTFLQTPCNAFDPNRRLVRANDKNSVLRQVNWTNEQRLGALLRGWRLTPSLPI